MSAATSILTPAMRITPLPPHQCLVALEAAVRHASFTIYANAGVKMGFGSDLLGEMHAFQCGEFRIRADVPGNLEALRSATTVAAEIVNMPGQLGVIAAGAIADVVVLDGNPLDDIGVVAGDGESVAYVLQRGKIVKARATLR